MTQVCYSGSPKSASPPGAQLSSHLSFQHFSEKVAVSNNAINRSLERFLCLKQWQKERGEFKGNNGKQLNSMAALPSTLDARISSGR